LIKSFRSIKNLIAIFFFFGFTLSNNISIYTFASEINTKTDLTKKNSNLQQGLYLLGPGDIVNITFFDSQEFSGSYKILSDGYIYLPLVGKVLVDGLSIELSKQKIETLYSKELLRPNIHLVLEKSRPIKISVIGEVQRPGLYSLLEEEEKNENGVYPSLNVGEMPTLVDAIQKAGGITQNANLRKISISRVYIDENNNNNYKKTMINLLDLLVYGFQKYNLYLFDGDIIEIPKSEQLSEKIMRIAKANLSPSKINVDIVGQVENPGRISINTNTPLQQAVMLAGGRKKWKGKRSNVRLIRINKDGTISDRKFNLNNKKIVSDKYNPPLKDGDIVVVNSTLVNAFGTGLSEITNPITNIISGVTLYKLLGDWANYS